MDNKLNEPITSADVEEYTADDICKLLCALTTRMMRETGNNKANISKTIYGDGFKFEINLIAEPDLKKG